MTDPDPATATAKTRTILHIVSSTDDPLATEVINAQRAAGTGDVRVFDLSTAPVDYDRLLDEIFAADSVQVW